MTEKQLKNLSRIDLMELLLEQTRYVDQLEAELDNMGTKMKAAALNGGVVSSADAGASAEALAASDELCRQMLENARKVEEETRERCQVMMNEAQEHAREVLTQSYAHCEEVVREAEDQAAGIVSGASYQADPMRFGGQAPGLVPSYPYASAPAVPPVYGAYPQYMQNPYAGGYMQTPYGVQPVGMAPGYPYPSAAAYPMNPMAYYPVQQAVPPVPQAAYAPAYPGYPQAPQNPYAAPYTQAPQNPYAGGNPAPDAGKASQHAPSEARRQPGSSAASSVSAEAVEKSRTEADYRRMVEELRAELRQRDSAAAENDAHASAEEHDDGETGDEYSFIGRPIRLVGKDKPENASSAGDEIAKANAAIRESYDKRAYLDYYAY